MEQEENIQEIDFIGIINIIRQRKKLIYKVLIIFTIIGLFVSVFTPNEYRASTIFVPQGADKNVRGNLGGLAALAGVNIGNGAGDSGIPLSLYSEIINSIPFQRELIKTPITVAEREDKVTYKEYYGYVYKPGLLSNLKKYTIGLPGVILNIFKGKNKETGAEIVKTDSVLHITTQEKYLFDKLKGQLSLVVRENENSVRISAIMTQALPAAEITNNAQKLLEKYIIHLKVEKSSSKLAFIRKRYEEIQKEFKIKQQQLANYQDRNRYASSARSQSRLITLQSEYDLTFNVFNELATQIETQQIKVKEDTPIFTIIKPVSVPLTKFAPKRLIILIIWMFSGIVIGLGLIFGRKYYCEFKNKLNEV